MIVVKVKDKEYTIYKDFSVSDGEYKFFIEHCIRMISFDYKVWKGSFPKYLYANLGNFKSIELVSFNYTPPDDKNLTY